MAAFSQLERCLFCHLRHDHVQEMEGLQLGGAVDSLAACTGNGGLLLAGLSNFIGPFWTGGLALLAEGGDGGGPTLVASAELRSGAPAVAALPEKDPFTGRLLLASGGDDCSVALWEAAASPGAAELQPAQALVHHDDIVSGLAAGASNGELASCSLDGSLRLWDCRQLLACTAQLVGHRGAVHAVCWEPEEGGVLVSAGQDGTLKVWDPRRPSSAVASLAVGAPALAVALPPQQPHLTLAGDVVGGLTAFDWRAPGRPLLARSKVLGDAVRSIACSGAAGTAGGGGLDVAVGGDDGQVVLCPSKELAGGALATIKVAHQAQVPSPVYVRALAWGSSGLYRGSWDAAVAPVPL